jgi:hypothetical protein
MQTRSEISQLFRILYVVGLVLLVSAFFLLVPSLWRTPTAFLDLAVLGIVFTVNFPLFFAWSTKSDGFNAKIPALGLLVFCDLFYSCFALGFGLFAIHFLLPFRVQFVYQMGLLFVATATVGMSWFSSAHTVEVTEEEQVTRSGLDGLKAAISACEAEISIRLPIAGQVRQRLLKLQEDARYLSPSRENTALSYERQMAALIDEIRLQVGDTAISASSSTLDGQLEQCATLMALRKQVR